MYLFGFRSSDQRVLAFSIPNRINIKLKSVKYAKVVYTHSIIIKKDYSTLLIRDTSFIIRVSLRWVVFVINQLINPTLKIPAGITDFTIEIIIKVGNTKIFIAFRTLD